MAVDGDGKGMGDDEPPAAPDEGPRLSRAGRARVDDRRTRQAEALRANLRRRKEQQRARGRDANVDDTPDDRGE